MLSINPSACSQLGRDREVLLNNSPFTFTVEVAGSPPAPFTIPCQDLGVFYARIDWGDGNKSLIKSYNDSNLTHQYAVAGTYEIKIYGRFANIYFNNTGDKLALRTITNWGNVGWRSFRKAFYGCTGLTSVTSTTHDTSKLTDMTDMFYGCNSITTLDATTFNTSSVTGAGMNSVFYQCSALTTLDLSGWDVSGVVSLSNLVYFCNNLTTIGDVSGWDTSNVTGMANMFFGCSNLASVDVSNFNMSKVTSLGGMFQNCSSLTSLDVSGWDLSKATFMLSLFSGCSNLTSIGDISGWNTSKATNMAYMFNGCTGLNSSLNLAGLDINALTSDLTWLCHGMTLTTANYDATLESWASQAYPSNIAVDFGSSTYSLGGSPLGSPASSGQAARTILENAGWTFTDGGGV